MAPPMRIASAFSSRRSITLILSETFAPPRMTMKGRAGCHTTTIHTIPFCNLPFPLVFVLCRSFASEGGSAVHIISYNKRDLNFYFCMRARDLSRTLSELSSRCVPIPVFQLYPASRQVAQKRCGVGDDNKPCPKAIIRIFSITYTLCSQPSCKGLNVASAPIIAVRPGRVLSDRRPSFRSGRMEGGRKWQAKSYLTYCRSRQWSRTVHLV